MSAVTAAKMEISTKIWPPTGAPRRSEALEAPELQVAGHRAQAVVVLAVDVPDGGEESGREVEAGDGGGVGRAGDAVAAEVDGAEVVGEEQEPVAEGVDQVGGDEGHGDGADVVEGLQVAAQGEVEQERGGSGVERLEEADGLGEDRGLDGQVVQGEGAGGDDGHQERGEQGGEDEAVEQPAVGVVELARAVGLRDVGVEAEQDAADAEGEGVVDDLGECGGGDGDGRVGQVADHDGVDDGHEHPAEFGEDERQGEREHGLDFVANGRHLQHSSLPPVAKS